MDTGLLYHQAIQIELSGGLKTRNSWTVTVQLEPSCPEGVLQNLGPFLPLGVLEKAGDNTWQRGWGRSVKALIHSHLRGRGTSRAPFWGGLIRVTR